MSRIKVSTLCLASGRLCPNLGTPQKFINMVLLFSESMEARVKDNGEFSELFPVTNGIKQGCVLAPTFFNMLFSAMQTDAFRNVGFEFPFKNRRWFLQTTKIDDSK